MAISQDPDSGLTVQIENEQSTYRPGDKILGQVQLVLKKDAGIGSVAIELSGHTNSTIIQSNGQSESVLRSDSLLFREERLLHDGHYKHKKGTFLWPFEFHIPEEFDPSESRNEKWHIREGFLTTNADRQLYPLPPSFRFADSKMGKAWQASITYALEATFVEFDDAKMLSSSQKRSCVKPIRLFSKLAPEPIDANDPRSRAGHSTTCTVRTLKLVQGQSGSPMMQRAQSIFRSSSLPRFTFEIDVSYPAVVQPYHPQPIPFIIAASPRTEAELTTIQPNLLSFYRYPTVVIREFKLSLEVVTQCRCPSVLSDTYMSASHEILLANHYFDDTRLAIRSVAWDQKVGKKEDIPTNIDLGKQCGIRISTDPRDGIISEGKNANNTEKSSNGSIAVHPSFVTCNVSRRYWFRWDINLECAGEKITVKGRSPSEITVLRPTSSHIGEASPEDESWIIAPPVESNSRHNEEEHAVRSEDVLPAYNEIVETAPRASSARMRQSKGP